MTLSFSEVTIISSLEHFSLEKKIPATDLIVLDINDENEKWYLNTKKEILKHFGFVNKLLAFADQKKTKSFIKNGILKSYDYISYSYTLRELELCIDATINVSRGEGIDEVIVDSEEKYKIFIEKSNDGIVFIQNGKLIYGNPRILTMIGVPLDEFISQPIERYINKSEFDKLKEWYRKWLSGEKVPLIYETKIHRISGELIHVEFTINIANYRGGITTIVFVRDISSRKLAKKYLTESEETYRSLFDNSSDSIYIQDSKGVFLDANKAAIELYGYSKSEIVGKTPEILSASGKNDFLQDEKRIKEVLEGKTQHFEFWAKTKGGRIFPVEVVLNKGKYFGMDVIFAMGRDITERKNTEDILKESEDKYRTLAEQIPVGLYRITIDGRFLYANLALAKILGFSSVAELMQHNANDFYPSDNPRADIIERILKLSQPFNDEQKLIRKDGRYIWVRDNGHVTCDSNGEIYYIDGVIENITEKKQAAEALRNSETNLRVMLNAIPDLLFRINSNGVYIGFLSEHNDPQKTPPERLIGASLHDFFPQEISDAIHSSIKKCLETGALQTIEYPMTINNEVQFFETRIVSANRDEVLCLARNITRRKAVEARITMLAQAIENILECVSITNTENRFIYVNPAFCKTYRYKEEEIIGKHISILRPPSVSPDVNNEINRMTIEGGWLGELVNVRKDGSEFPISLSATTVRDDKGQIIAYVGVATDITERKNTEQELIRAKDKAEESDRLKTAFLANMSHEIRSPMNAILGFIRIIKDEETLSENGKQYIELVSKSGFQLISVIEDILDTSKIQANQLRLSYREFDLNALLSELYSIFGTQLSLKPKMSTILLPPMLSNPSPFIINSDDLRIRQILTNLLSNAIKFTPKGMIEFGYSIIIDDENPLIRFFVRDTGIGLAPDKCNLIFERFRQADDSYTRMYGGSGLGLAISKGLTELLGGKIWVESEDGKGSTFYFTLPFQRMFDEAKEMQPEETVARRVFDKVDGLNWSGKTIFIVEDIQDIQFFLKKIFEKTGANLLFSSTLMDAKKVFHSNNKIDLVLLDIRLPDGDGYELSQEFKKKSPKIPIIAQTAYAMHGEKEKSVSFGCDDFITKPIDPSLLFFKIQNIFQKG